MVASTFGNSPDGQVTRNQSCIHFLAISGHFMYIAGISLE